MIVSNEQILTFLQAAGVTITVAGQALVTLLQPQIEGLVKTFLGYSVEQASYTEFHPANPSTPTFELDSSLPGWDIQGGMAVQFSRGDPARQALQLRQIPVRSVASVYENRSAYQVAGGDWPATTLLPTNSYYLDCSESGISWTGQLLRVSGVWSSTRRTIKVTYTAGLTALEIDSHMPGLKLAVLKAITGAYLTESLKSRSLTAFGLPGGLTIKDFSVSLDNGATFGLITGSAGPGGFALTPDVKQMLEPWVNYGRYFGS